MANTDPPDHCSVSQIYTALVEPGREDVNQTLHLLEQYLLHLDGLCREPGDSKHAQKLFSWLAEAIKPIGDLLIKDDRQRIEDLVSKSATAFNCMRQLQAHFLLQEQVNPDALLSIIAYTDAEDPWTLEATQRVAEQVLDYHQEQLRAHSFLVEEVLVGFIRPLFSDSHTTSVTSHGRKAITQTIRKPLHLRDLDPSKRPWKFREVSAMTVLRWAIKNMDENMFQKNWHLCIPPLLTLLDDPSTVIRVRGLLTLSDLLRRMPSKLLQQTGLDEVFEDAVMPTLLFLPEITPTEESLSLLTSAYSVLSSLGEVRYPTKEDRSKKTKFLDRIMRQGVIQGFLYSGDDVRIAELLVKEVVSLIESMGVHAVKYLKDIIPLLSKILTDPFGPSHPSLLLAAAKATRTTVVNCWPRMTESTHRIELLKGLTLCWVTVNGEMETEDESKRLELEGVRQALQLAAKTLVRSVAEKLDVMEELQPLMHVDPSLSSLFRMETPVDAIVT